MKPFDLDAARRGAAVCIAEGREVTLLGFDDVAKCICGYILSSGAILHEHYMWALDGKGGVPAHDLQMRDDDYAERLERGEYEIPDSGFIRESTPEQKSADQADPKAEMGYTEVPTAFDGAAIASILSRLFGTPAPATRLRINIEYEGAPMTFDPSKVSEALADLYKESGVLAESAPESKQEVS